MSIYKTHPKIEHRTPRRYTITITQQQLRHHTSRCRDYRECSGHWCDARGHLGLRCSVRHCRTVTSLVFIKFALKGNGKILQTLYYHQSCVLVLSNCIPTVALLHANEIMSHVSMMYLGPTILMRFKRMMTVRQILSARRDQKSEIITFICA